MYFTVREWLFSNPLGIPANSAGGRRKAAEAGAGCGAAVHGA
jgi:hypothetical protein